MRTIQSPTRIAQLCLVLATTTACAQELHREPQRLSQAVQVSARPLPQTNAASELELRGRRTLPSFPFRQISANEPIAAHQPAAARKLAPRSSVTKKTPIQPPAPTPTTAIGTVVSSLAIVLGLFVALVWLSKRFALAGSTPLPKEAVERLGQAPLAGRQSMQLIRVGKRLLLVAVSTNGAETLTEITDPTEVEHLAGLCRHGRSDSASATFGRVLSQMATESGETAPRTRARGVV